MNNEILFAILRHALTTFGGVLVANGTLTGSQLNEGIGAFLALVGLAWSISQKYRAAAK